MELKVIGKTSRRNIVKQVEPIWARISFKLGVEMMMNMCVI
jgi:hypothetical protein